MIDEVQDIHITGATLNYFFICQRKAWLFAKGLNMENISGNTDIIKGKVLHEERFKRQRQKEVQIENIKIDFLTFGDEVFIHEVKKSKKFEDAHIWQLKYYIYVLQRKGINCSSGVLHYPSSMRKVDVVLTDEDREQIRNAIISITEMLKKPLPNKLERKMCQKCAYFDFCSA